MYLKARVTILTIALEAFLFYNLHQFVSLKNHPSDVAFVHLKCLSQNKFRFSNPLLYHAGRDAHWAANSEFREKKEKGKKEKLFVQA